MLFRETLFLCCYPAIIIHLESLLNQNMHVDNSAVGVDLQKGVCRRYEALLLHFLCKIAPPSLTCKATSNLTQRLAKEAGACEGSRRSNAVEVWCLGGCLD